MINGAHAILYRDDADATLRPWPRCLGRGRGTPAAAGCSSPLPPGELAVHPPDAGNRAVCTCCATTYRHRGSQAEG
jgi:hypothetical protein